MIKKAKGMVITQQMTLAWLPSPTSFGLVGCGA